MKTLQISNKNGGYARITVFTTNTVHHFANCFGTTPREAEANGLLQNIQGFESRQLIIDELAKLKTYHQTEKSVDELIEFICF